MKYNQDIAGSELRQQIAETMMGGWLESMKDGVLHIDGGESTITKSYINPKVLDKLEALYAAHDAEKKQQVLAAFPEKHNAPINKLFEADDNGFNNCLNQCIKAVGEAYRDKS